VIRLPNLPVEVLNAMVMLLSKSLATTKSEDIEITLKIYAHTLPTMQKGAAVKMHKIFTARSGKEEAKG
jgi:hypothetical protein